MMKKILAVALVLLSVSVSAFEGKIKVKFGTYNGSSEKFDFTWFVSENKLSIEMLVSGTENVTCIIPDLGSKKLLTYNKSNQSDKRYMAIPINISTEDANDIQVAVTEQTKKILGYDCKKIIVTTESQITEAWVTYDIAVDWKPYAAFFKTSDEIQGLAKAGIRAFPLQATTVDKAGQTVNSFVAELVQQEKVAKNAFSVPSDFEEYKNPNPIKRK
jgi:hypothetical protein